MKRQNAWRICLCLLLCDLLPTPGLAAPPPPADTVAQATMALQEALPPTWPLLSVEAAGDVITVCLDVPPATLRAGDGIGAEMVAETVRVALTSLDWRILHVQSRDPLTQQCRALSEFLPQVAPVNLAAPNAEPELPSKQPTSANAVQSLSGKTVYISAGHGWQWGKDYSDSYAAKWLTQRGIYQGFIEDHNNAEVVAQYLIPYLQNAGANVIPVRERDWSPQRIIADNDAGAPIYSETGVWSAGAGAGYNGGAYRVATSVNGSATAVATWQMSAPQTGVYALYAWVLPDVSRATDAHYTIHHAGGVSTVELNQRTYPQTWRYLGTFPFYAGPITVTLDNSASVTGATVMADALRLGGGAFDSLAGIETLAPQPPNKPWWETSTRYYAQWMGLDPNDWSSFNDVVARPIFARWNYADSGGNAQAVYISWHTNGYNGAARGTESYVYNDAATRTAGSVELQQAVHDELIRDIRAGWDAAWTDRGKKQADLGEVRALWDSNPAARMPGVLLEIAFHDQVDDANALKDPGFEQLAARAVYQGILHYFETSDGVALTELPEPPTHLRVENQGSGNVRVSWNASPTDGVGLVGDAATGYRLYTSPDGFAWSAPIAVSALNHTLTGLTHGQTLYVKVTATNAGGESFPTEVLGARVGESKLLIVNAFDRINRYGLYVDDDTLMGPSQRLWLDRLNRRDYAVHHGQAIPAQYAWDSASNEAVYDDLVNLRHYQVVDWLLGEESSSADGTLNPAERAALAAFLANDGALFISSAELAWDLEEIGRDPNFLHQTLRTDYIADDAGTYTVSAVAGGAFAGLPDFTFDAPGEYDADYPDVIAPYPGGDATETLRYGGGTGGVAAVQFAQGCRRYLGLGFPFEVIRPEFRGAVMTAALDFLGVCLQAADTSIAQPQANGYYSSTPAFNGVATGGGIVRIEVQIRRDGDHSFWTGSEWGAQTWVTAAGTTAWAYALPALTDGAYSLQARAVVTQPEATPAAAGFIYDATPPLAPTPVEPTGTVTIWQPALRWLAPADNGSPLSYQIELDGQIHPATGTSYPVSPGAGAHSWRVRAVDAANNIGPWSVPMNFTIEVESVALYLPLVLRDYAAAVHGCTLILDSDFESAGGWVYNNLAVRVTDVVHQGAYAARVGIPPGQPGQAIYSSISQTLTLPADAVSATLRMWAYPVAEELTGDYHYVILHNMEGESQVLSTLTTDSRAWQAREFDLSAYSGQNISLFIGARNDGDDDTAALYLDEVQLEICR